MHEIPPLLHTFREALQERILPLLSRQFSDSFDGDGSKNIFVNDAFIVKYSYESDDREKPRQRYLPLHTDQSTHSLIISLNEHTEYSGGGTYFANIRTVLKVPIGKMVSFAGGSVYHGGEPITGGTRFVCVRLFFYKIYLFCFRYFLTVSITRQQ